MTSHSSVTTKTDLSDRVDTVGWGVLFLVVGAVGLTPSMPDGAWLVAAGLVMLGATAVRRWLRLPIRGLTVVVGIVALTTGVFTVAGLTSEVGPLVLIVLGLTLIVGAVYRAQRSTDVVALGQSR